MSLFTYYAYRDSPLHRVDPRIKALWVLTGVLLIFTTSDWRLLLALAAVNLALVPVAGLSPRVLLPVLRALVLFGIVILGFQVLFQGGETFWRLGPLGLHTRGLVVTREVWLRLANLSLLFVGYVMWTHPTDIALMWIRLGLPYRYALLGGLALRFFPIFQLEVVRIQEAQQARGQALHTTPRRIAGLLPVMLPFVLRVLRRANAIAVAMELRGFGYAPTRTFSRRIGMTRVDWALAAVLGALIAGRALRLIGLL